MRWKSGTTITNEPFIFDSHHHRAYWLDGEQNIIACIMNGYEDKVEQLESSIKSKGSYIPLKSDIFIDEITWKMRNQLNSCRFDTKISQGDGWEVKSILDNDGIKYEVILRIEKVRE